MAAIPTDYERNAAHLEKDEFVTANCFYRRKALEMIGGFDECFAMAWREDSDLIFTLMELIEKSLLPHSPNAVVIHPVRSAPWGISLRQQRKSMFNALLYKTNEIKKCDVLCVNCHAKRHWKETHETDSWEEIVLEE